MPISAKTKEALYQRARSRCECTMKTCVRHTGRCNAMLRGAWKRTGFALVAPMC